MSRRMPETLVDWLVVGIAPFLIMLLVGSLVFYLVEVFYLGEYQLRLLWVLGLFVMAIVCVARISMEEGAAYASLYALPLALAVGLAVATFVQVRGPLAPLGPLVNWSLMAIIWWSAHKLTWDCTLIEGGRDFTGQGLMQTTGLDRFFKIRKPGEQPANAPPPRPEVTGTSDTTPPAAMPVWKWWLGGEQRPHAPGVWVVYFSLAALPLFGLGQWFMPANELDLRRRAFWLLVVYVAAGLSLLMATSFLSLRRYLRQRNLEMPGEMAAMWLGTGSVMVVVLLILASLLPRPNPEYSVTHLAPKLKGPDLSPSRWGWGKEGAKSKPDATHTGTKGEPSQHAPPPQGSEGTPTSGQSGGQQGDSKQVNKQQGGKQQNGSSGSQSNQQGEQNSSDSSEQPANDGQGNSEQSSANRQNESPSDSNPQDSSSQQQANSDAKQTGDSADADGPRELPQETAPPPPLNQSAAAAVGQLFAFFMHALKWLFYLLVAAVIAYQVWVHRERLWAAWQQLLVELRALWEKWFGQKTAAASVAEPAPSGPPPKRFNEYADPFATGLAARWSLAELVRYTFEALEARGREQNCPRGAEQTPLEYAAAVGQVEPTLASDFRWLADLYGQLAFAGGQSSPQSTTLLQQLWQRWK